MKTILVPIDFSDCATNALQYAIILAEKLNYKLLLFHSFYSPHASGHLSMNDVVQGKKTAKDIALQDLEELFNKYVKNPAQKIEYFASPSEFRSELNRLSDQEEIAFIVMGTLGMGEISGKFFGTNTSRAIEQVSCPVFAIPQNKFPEELKNIIYASEYLSSDIEHLKTLSVIAAQFNAMITLVHVSSNDTEEETAKFSKFKQMAGQEEELKSIAFKTLAPADVEEALEAYIGNNPADLLVMSAQERDLFDKVFGKSFTKIMAHQASIPMLFFHHRK